MRPSYETEADRMRQKAVADFVAEKFGARFISTPRQYPFDYLVQFDDGAPMLLCEIKCRTRRRLSAESWILSAMKFVHARTFRDTFGVDTIFVFRFGDGEVAYFDALARKRELGFGGRSDRNDPQDMEPVARIMSTEFRHIGYVHIDQ